MWVDPKTQCSFLQWVTTLIDPSQKNYDDFHNPEIDFLNIELW
jgi:hypothetical protein